VKERVCALAMMLAFKRYPPQLIVEMMHNYVFWLKSIPHCDGVQETMSVRTIMTGQRLDYNKHCRVQSTMCKYMRKQ